MSAPDPTPVSPETEGDTDLSGSDSEGLTDPEVSTYEIAHPEIVVSDSDDGFREGQDGLQGMTKKEWKKHVKAEARERRESKNAEACEKKRRETLAKRRRGTKTKK